jgi:hypothetical protein
MQVVPQTFIDRANGQVRPHAYGLRMSFDKAYDSSVSLFKLNESLLDGPDVLSPSADNPIQKWDYYAYKDYTGQVQSMEWTRELDFPYSVISAMADFVLENHMDYFTPNSGSPIDQYILPKRPVRLLSGFGNHLIPQFVGLTEKMPVIEDKSKTASFHAIDFLSQMFTMEVNKTIAMQNARTDQVLAEIFEQFGLAPEQYSLPVCRNVIPFVFFEKGANAGQIIRDLMQAEGGRLWLDEQGLIKLDPRVAPVLSPVMTFDQSNVVDIKTTGDTRIINMVKIFAQTRAVQDYQPVFSKTATDTSPFIVPAGGSRQFEADLQDPALSVTTPSFGYIAATSWFTAVMADGGSVVSGVTVTAHELRTNAYVFTINNANGYPVTIDSMELWGQPAKVVDSIEYTEVDQASIDNYEESPLEIRNNFIQSINQCDALALIILDQFAEYSNEIELTVKGNPAIQLGDVIEVNVRSYTGTYRIVKTFNRLMNGGCTQVLTARKTVLRSWFVLDQSLLNGTDVLTP